MNSTASAGTGGAAERYPRSRSARVYGPLTRILNPILMVAWGRFAFTAVLEHRGRRSGRLYRTPVAMTPAAADVVVPLTFGQDADWCRNVLAAGGARYLFRGRWHEGTEPRLAGFEAAAFFGPLLRVLLRLQGIRGFLVLRGRAER